MRIYAIALSLISWAVLCLALHESDVGVVDWHKLQIGVPLHETTSTAPIFHRVGGKNTQSVVISATGSNVLAAVNPVNGSVVWRYVFDPQDRIASFRKDGSIVTSLSGFGGATLRSFDVLTGDLLLERRLHDPALGLLSEPNHLGTFVAFGNKTQDLPDFFVLTNGHTVNHISGPETKWSWTSEDQSSLVIYSTILPTSDAIYVLGLAKSFASYTLHVTALSPVTGDILSSTAIPSSISNGLTDITILSTPSPRIIWLESETIKSLVLTPTIQDKPSALKGSSYQKIVDVGLSAHGMLVGIKFDGTGQVITADDKGIKVLKEFEGSAPSERRTESMYAGGFDKDGNPYIARLYWSLFLRLASTEIYAPHLAEGKGLIAGYSFPFDTNTHGIIKHMTIDAANPGPHTVLGRLFLTTSTGAIQLWQQDKLQWTREEGLTELIATEFVELPERVLLSGEARGEEGFTERVLRQIKDARDLPSYLLRFVKRFATGSYESATSSAASSLVGSASASSSSSSLSSTTTTLPFRDAFGFRQVLVGATSYGKIYGIDTSNGEILWSRVLGLVGESGVRVLPVEDKMFVVRNVGDADDSGEAKGPEVVLVAKRVVDGSSSEDIILFHFNALTGQDAMGVSKDGQPLQGLEAFQGSLLNAYLLNAEQSRVVVLLDSQLKVHLYPNTPSTQATFTSTASSLSVPLQLPVSSQGQRRLVGHQFIPLAEGAEAYPTWTLSFPDGEDIQSIIPPSSRGRPVASIGKVLGNRTTLYKYLNERLFILLTAPHSSLGSGPAAARCGLYLVDGVKGSVVYHATLPTAGGGCNVKAALTENWLVYHYYDEEFQGVGQAKGYKMVSVEFYEGKNVDDKTKSSEMTSYSDKNLDVTVFEQSFVYPHGISAITTTSTKFGITSKDIIVANTNNKIQSFSRRFLDPRRPMNRKPTNEEMEEFLFQYDPLLPDDSRRVISHTYQVINTRRIITAPALLESTSLVFAYGLDLFLTRVAPSSTFDVLNENFNKVQLVLTVSGLAVAILVTKPMVRRKRLRERWYQY